MDLLKRFGTSWRAFTRRHRSVSEVRPPPLASSPYESGPISPTERLSRFIFDKGGFTASTQGINFRQFLPPNRGEHTEEVSVMRTESLAEGAVWDLGKRPRLKLRGVQSGRVATSRFRMSGTVKPGRGTSMFSPTLRHPDMLSS